MKERQSYDEGGGENERDAKVEESEGMVRMKAVEGSEGMGENESS